MAQLPLSATLNRLCYFATYGGDDQTSDSLSGEVLQMTGPLHSVFISYASEDSEVAQKISEALRTRGIQTFLDRSELRGGDAWDQKIRHEIHECTLFIPIVSQHTQNRLEGYFRHEWKLAVERTHHMAEQKAFLVPIVVDSTHDRDAFVPDGFRAVQWTRLPGGETTPAFVERIKRLLSPSNSEASAMASGVSAAASELVHTSRRSRLVELIIATVVTCAAIVYLLADWPGISITTKGFFGATGALNSANSAGSEAALALPAHSVAVLPFTNLSGDPQQEYFSDGISEELINALSHIDALAVAARTSSFAFKGKEVDVVTIGRQLHVGAILEGSIRRSGNTIRITAQLINSATGFHMWSEDYDRDLRDILVLQTDIATAVAQQLRAKLLGGEAARIELGGTHVPAAYDAYLLGRQLDRMNTLDGYRRAAAANLKATELDPLYARAYANLSLAEANAADYTNDLVGLENARLAAEKALSLQPELVDGYIARFAVRRYLLDFSGARADAERALALSPNKTNSQTVYGTMLATFGRLPEAIAAMNKAIELDPLNESAWLDLAQYFTVGHDFPAAHRAFERAQAISPDDDVGHFALGILDLLEGRHENSFAEFQAGDEVVRLTGMALVEHSRGNEPKSQQALAALIAKHSVEAAYQVAEVYAWRGDKNKAFEWLDRSFRQRDDGLSDVVYDVLLTDLRTDPRYRVLLKRLKLLEE